MDDQRDDREGGGVQATTGMGRWYLLALFPMLAAGALFGAFVVAPLRWPKDSIFTARQSIAAFCCAALAVFLGSLVFALVQWLQGNGWRFSLRALLIGMTLVAATFGLIVWAAK